MAATTLAACGGGPSPQPDSTPGTLAPHQSPPPPSGPTVAYATDATLTLGLPGEPANWNPLAAPARTDPALAVVAAAVLPSASIPVNSTAVDPTVGSALVVSATLTSTAPQTVVYRVNPRATWSDGVPITGADFVYTWQAQSGRAQFRDVRGRRYTPASTEAYRRIASVRTDAQDEDRVVVRFADADPDWRSLFSPILPAHTSRAVGFDRGFSDPVTSLTSGGPYLVQSYRPGSDVLLVRNPRWWGPTPHLASIDVVFVDSPLVAAAALEQGQLDASLLGFTPATVAALRATAGLSVSVTDGPTYDDLVLDERRGALAERAVRLALVLAVDRAALARSAIASGDSAASPVRSRVSAPGTAGYRDDTEVLGPGATIVADPARGESLLLAAGYVRRGATLTRHGRPVRLTMAVGTTSPLAVAETRAVTTAARSLGITVTVVPVTSRAGRAADLRITEMPLDAVPSRLAATYGTGGTTDTSGYSSALTDGLLARLAGAGSGREAAGAADLVDAQLWADAVDLPLLGNPRVLAVQQRYVGIAPARSPSGIGSDPARWGIPLST